MHTLCKSTRRGPLLRGLHLLGALLLLVLLPGAAAPDVGVYGHPELAVQTLDDQALRRIFLGMESTWPGGERVQLVLPPSGSAEMAWLCAEIRVSERLLKRGLMEKALNGAIAKPILAEDAEEAERVVAAERGAVTPLVVAERPSLRALELQ